MRRQCNTHSVIRTKRNADLVLGQYFSRRLYREWPCPLDIITSPQLPSHLYFALTPLELSDDAPLVFALLSWKHTLASLLAALLSAVAVSRPSRRYHPLSLHKLTAATCLTCTGSACQVMHMHGLGMFCQGLDLEWLSTIRRVAQYLMVPLA